MKIALQQFKEIANLANYPIFSLLVFFVFFVAITVWAITYSKEDSQRMEKLPLE